MSKVEQMMTAAMQAERRAKAVWVDSSKSAQEKQAAVWEAECAWQQAENAMVR